MPTAEDVGAAVDVDEYRFADRHTAARAWTIAAALTQRHPDLLLNSAVAAGGAQQLVVHDAAEVLTVRLDRVAGVVLHDPERRSDHLTWDEVFASTTARIVRRLEHGTILRTRTVPTLPEVAQRAAPICHEAIAILLRANVDAARSWTARQVRCGPHEEQVEAALLARFDPEGMLADAVRAYFERCLAHGWWYSPVWELARDLEPVCLIETDTGRAFLPDGDRVGLRSFGSGHRVVAELSRAIARTADDR